MLNSTVLWNDAIERSRSVPTESGWSICSDFTNSSPPHCCRRLRGSEDEQPRRQVSRECEVAGGGRQRCQRRGHRLDERASSPLYPLSSREEERGI